MNRYERIYIDAISDSNRYEDVFEEVSGPLIVLTIEELREVWAMAKAGPDYPGVFELFLKSKGIEL